MSKPCPKVNPHIPPTLTKKKKKLLQSILVEPLFPNFPTFPKLRTGVVTSSSSLRSCCLCCCLRCCLPIKRRHSPFTPFRFITVNPSAPPSDRCSKFHLRGYRFSTLLRFSINKFSPPSHHIVEGKHTHHKPPALPLAIDNIC